MGEFGLFEADAHAQAEPERQQRVAAVKLSSAIADVRNQFGPFLTAATGVDEFDDRWNLARHDIRHVVKAHIPPVSGIMRRVKNAMKADFKVSAGIAQDPGTSDVSVRTATTTTAVQKGAPFANYKDFQDCVSSNSDKDDPKAYCGYIKHQTEDKKTSAHRELEASLRLQLSRRDMQAAFAELGRLETWHGTHTAGQDGDEPELSTEQTFEDHQGENLIPEGDFDGYLSEVDQGAPAKVQPNFGSGGDTGSDKRAAKSGEEVSDQAERLRDNAGKDTDEKRKEMTSSIVLDLYTDWATVNGLRCASLNTLAAYADLGISDADYHQIEAHIRQAEIPPQFRGGDDDDDEGDDEARAEDAEDEERDIQDGDDSDSDDDDDSDDEGDDDDESDDEDDDSDGDEDDEDEGDDSSDTDEEDDQDDDRDKDDDDPPWITSSHERVQMHKDMAWAIRSDLHRLSAFGQDDDDDQGSDGGGGDQPPPPDAPPQDQAAAASPAQDAPPQSPAAPQAAPAGGAPMENQPAEDALLDTASDAVMQMIDRETQEYQTIIDPLTQALQAIEYAQQVETAEHPLDVTPPQGTVDVSPSAALGGAQGMQQQARRTAAGANCPQCGQYLHDEVARLGHAHGPNGEVYNADPQGGHESRGDYMNRGRGGKPPTHHSGQTTFVRRGTREHYAAAAPHVARIAKAYGLSRNAVKMVFTAMGRRQYQTVADAISTLPPATRPGIAASLADMFAADNPRFSHDHFYSSAGVRMAGNPRDRAGDAWAEGRDRGDRQHLQHDLDPGNWDEAYDMQQPGIPSPPAHSGPAGSLGWFGGGYDEYANGNGPGPGPQNPDHAYYHANRKAGGAVPFGDAPQGAPGQQAYGGGQWNPDSPIGAYRNFADSKWSGEVSHNSLRDYLDHVGPHRFEPGDLGPLINHVDSIATGRSANYRQAASWSPTPTLDTFQFPQSKAPTPNDQISVDNLPGTTPTGNASGKATPVKPVKPITTAASVVEAKNVMDLWNSWSSGRASKGLNMGGDPDVESFANETKVGPKALDTLKSTLGLGSSTKTSSFFTRRVPGWTWDDHLNGYITSSRRPFECSCGEEVPVPGYGTCRCGKIWNSIAYGGQDHLANNTADMFIAREIPVRDGVIMANQAMAAGQSAFRTAAAEESEGQEWIEDEDRGDVDVGHAPAPRKQGGIGPDDHDVVYRDGERFCSKCNALLWDPNVHHCPAKQASSIDPGPNIDFGGMQGNEAPHSALDSGPHGFPGMGGFGLGPGTGENGPKISPVAPSQSTASRRQADWTVYDDDVPQGGPGRPPSTDVKQPPSDWARRDGKGNWVGPTVPRTSPKG